MLSGWNGKCGGLLEWITWQPVPWLLCPHRLRFCKSCSNAKNFNSCVVTAYARRDVGFYLGTAKDKGGRVCMSGNEGSACGNPQIFADNGLLLTQLGQGHVTRNHVCPGPNSIPKMKKLFKERVQWIRRGNGKAINKTVLKIPPWICNISSV